MSESVLYTVLIVIALALPFCIWMVDRHLTFFWKNKVGNYISLYTTILDRTLSKKKEEDEDTLRFYRCWRSWIASVAYSDIGYRLKERGRGNPPIIAWTCLSYAVYSLGKTLNDYKYVNTALLDLDDCFRFQRTNAIEDCIKELESLTRLKSETLISFKEAMKEYDIPYYEDPRKRR